MMVTCSIGAAIPIRIASGDAVPSRKLDLMKTVRAGQGRN
jgi:hypothetical protein